jgi:hypothetical protein
MIKALEAVLETVANLPDDKQAAVADALRDVVAEIQGVYVLDEDEKSLLRGRVESARRGEFASDEEVKNLLRRPWR